MKHGLKTKIAKATGKSLSFISQYFNVPEKNMSWETAKNAARAFPGTQAQWWADKKFDQILKALSKTSETT